MKIAKHRGIPCQSSSPELKKNLCGIACTMDLMPQNIVANGIDKRGKCDIVWKSRASVLFGD